MNPWQASNRERKVSRLLLQVPLADTIQVREALAVAVETDAKWRASLVAASGVREPSPETWSDLADAIRSRRLATADEIRAKSAIEAKPFLRVLRSA